MVVGTLLVGIITFLITVPISAFVLVLSSKLFKHPVGFSEAVKPALVIGGVGLVMSFLGLFVPALALALGGLSFLVSIALYLALPHYMLGFELKESLLVGLVWFVLMIVASVIIGLVLSSLFLIVGLSAAVAAA